MKPFITVIYHPEEGEFRIQYQEQQLDMNCLDQVTLAEWRNPFVKNNRRWYGLYEELKQLCGEDDFKVIFDGTEDDHQVIREMLSAHHIEILTLMNKVVIVYQRETCCVKVNVNGRMMDTSRIEGVPLERTIGENPTREWKGLFPEIEEYLGHTAYTVSFVGNSENMRCLIEACPQGVDLSYKVLKQNELKPSAEKVTEAVATSASVIKETVSVAAKPILNTAKETIQNGSETMTVGKFTFTKVRVAKALILAGLICFLFPFATVSCAEADGLSKTFSGFQLITAWSANHKLAAEGYDVKLPGNILLLLAFLAGVWALIFLILRKLLPHLPGKLRGVLRIPASRPHRMGGILCVASVVLLLAFRLTIKVYYSLDNVDWEYLKVRSQFGYLLCLLVMTVSAVLCLTAKEEPISEELLEQTTGHTSGGG